MGEGTILNPINSLATPWSLVMFFLHLLKWPSACTYLRVFFYPLFSHCFSVAVKSYTSKKPVYSLFWRSPNAFLPYWWLRAEFKISLTSRGNEYFSLDTGFSVLFSCSSVQYSGGQGRCHLCDLSWCMTTRKRCSTPWPERSLLHVIVPHVESGKESKRIVEEFELYPPLWVCLWVWKAFAFIIMWNSHVLL